MKRGSAISVGLSYAGIGVGICFGIALGVLTFVMFRAYRKKK